MSQLTYVFRSAPHSRASGREGIDALLAASAYCEDIQVVFIGDGVYQLLQGQQTAEILSKDYSPMMKLFDLYDIERVYACQASLAERGLAQADLVIEADLLERAEVAKVLQNSGKILTF
ncbi:sulfurtransferase complex subunit TusC [Vibrio aquaticus]|uniref:Protein TusC homolog n=1 Tax=Vibrio aquaticus TaxID=2496559 RepID=A0A432CTW4_9VIBR|nr:sulfurtransferase complex subunit TusC [Vibrio aquaticus]RTZ13649.1 sulfurtransferase complex subunit TusC [Vibrio aquaticus]